MTSVSQLTSAGVMEDRDPLESGNHLYIIMIPDAG